LLSEPLNDEHNQPAISCLKMELVTPTNIEVNALTPIVLQIALKYALSTYFLNLLIETGDYKQVNTDVAKLI
jgi:uncharacterized membrane protein YwzB